MSRSTSEAAKREQRPGGPPGGGPRVPLRLTVARGGLGLELYEPIELGPLTMTALEVSLENLRFPVDLSGGVPVFRHRRGRLEQVRIALSLDALGRTLTRRLRDVLGGLERPVTVWAIEDGIGIGLVGAVAALAFDLVWVPVESDARAVVCNARAARLDGVALAAALQIVDTAFGGFAERRGRMLRVPRAALRLARATLPAIGARAPRATIVRPGALEVGEDAIHLTMDSTFAPPPLGAPAARALELAKLTESADDRIATEDWDGARAALIAALERAPRHVSIVELIAEIDLRAGARAEAALSLLAETMPVVNAGAIGAELLARTGDFDGARHALEQTTRAEQFAPVAALRWQRLAELESTLAGRIAALDEAVSRAPALASPRWARLDARLERGDVEGAVADAEHLEAAASGTRARHEICRRTAQALLRAGFLRDSGRLFERALRYLPDDPDATAGLARALIDIGKVDRGAALLVRAIELSEAAGSVHGSALLDLARVLAERFGDLPQAIARARAVPVSSPRALEARFLEGRWRARLGDLAGASVAFARAREALDLASAVNPKAAVEWLTEAALFERDVMHDPMLVEKHLALAVKLAPSDRATAAVYREAAAALARALSDRRKRPAS